VSDLTERDRKFPDHELASAVPETSIVLIEGKLSG